ncbi:YjjG family noncanonical pyrimidine nucleotidase [Paenisporosarcina antarctica]|uniref:Noncanonical pyrimidine nucleotidase, YjjG family n=1 Tax=Paenisporosarcina antarctica TaxID=417367 RepID=A0A4P6ZVA4_9BACL|nr:YjjG family noncanonical pyrimidine nucleotidase [Paenisporosarcina antarctica]QBP40271.1 noncanonical pyrimidine nucleotidase, YjjG family [Paenisporosarcina antarctica]
MKYDVLLFDLDDTLFDFSETEKHALDNSFHAFGLPNGLVDYRASYKGISKGLWNDLENGLVTLSELKVERFKRLFLQHQLTVNPEDFGQTYIENLGKEVHVIDGVEDMLKNLSSCRLVILTNGFQKVQHARIALSPLKHTFEAIFTSEESGYQKPQAEIFEYVFNKLHISSKKNVLMIGDSLTSDIQGGNNFGIDTCWFNPRQTENVTAINPTYEIRDFAELEQLVKQNVLVVK